ncbi:hypothetical protein ABFX02_03G068100 [Erythranthe guttata]
MMMGARTGFEYNYKFRVNDEIYPDEIIHLCGTQVFFFQIRTNFILTKKRLLDDDEEEDKEKDLMGSEIFETSFEDDGPEWLLQMTMSPRLETAYWMPAEESLLLASRALDFAKQTALNSPHPVDVVLVTVDLDVCTLQLEGETLDDAFGRAIRAECLPPLYLWPHLSPRNRLLTIRRVDLDLRLFLRSGLPLIRVEDVDQGLSVMDTCSICLCNPTIGAQLSLLACGHSFHYHCIVRWLMKSHLCPVCRFHAHDFPIRKF